MNRFYQPDLTANVDSPFVRGADNKLIRRSYWLDMDDKTLVMLMTQGIGAKRTTRSEPTWRIFGGSISSTKSVFRKSFRRRNRTAELNE